MMAIGSNAHILSMLVTVCMGLMVIVLRFRGTRKPTDARKIIIPPFGMATGFLMFVAPVTRIPWSYAGIAFLAGVVFFSYPLIRTSKFHVEDGRIYLKRSRWFVLIIISLLLIRIGLHDYVERYLTIPQTGAVFFILAFGMIVPWRIAMLINYRKVESLHGLAVKRE